MSVMTLSSGRKARHLQLAGAPVFIASPNRGGALT
jgi:hypothetical protein